MIKQILLFLVMMQACASAAYYNVVSELGASARAIALGNVEGFSDYATSVFSNPANLYQTRGYSVSFFTSRVMGEIDYSNICINSEVGKGIVGVGFYDANVKDLVISTEVTVGGSTTAEAESTFDYKSSIMKVSYQQKIRPKTSVGASAAFFNHRYAHVEGAGSNIDLGMIQEFEHYNLSLFAQNILRSKQVAYTNDDAAVEMLPFFLSATGQFFWDQFEFYPQLKYDRSAYLLSAGLLYKPSPWPFLDIMLGFKEQLDALENKHTRVSVGLGLKLASISVYYAYERSDYYLMDHNNYFSINYVL